MRYLLKRIAIAIAILFPHGNYSLNNKEVKELFQLFAERNRSITFFIITVEPPFIQLILS